MTSTQNHGYVTDYATGDAIRPATAQELARTEAKLASDDSDNYTGAWRDEDGRAVYVNTYGVESAAAPMMATCALCGQERDAASMVIEMVDGGMVYVCGGWSEALGIDTITDCETRRGI